MVHKSGSDTDELLNKLRTATTADRIEDIIDAEALEWHPLGGRDNNVGTVRSGSGPGQALTERLTNGIDANIERALHEDEFSDTPETPRDAVTKLFGLSKAGYNDMSQTWVKDTAEANLRLIMEEGASKTRPTIEVRDWGIGQRPENFPNTFVSLNKNSKITKPYLIGKYGQGGSNTFDFCEYAVIISRHVDGGPIGWTIVRFNPRLDEDELYSDGVFEYCTRPDDSIPSIDEEHDPDFVGTQVRLVEYDASDFSNILGPGKNSIYTVTHKWMFGSLFPFLVTDKRTERFGSYDEGGRSRAIVGSRYRLNSSSQVEESREFTRIDLDELGDLKMKCWVLTETGKVQQFVDKTHPVVFTLHGQRHHAESKLLLRNTNLTFLKDRLVVEVNCDDLSQEGKRIFSSTRDRAVEDETYDRVKTQVLEALKNDDDLDRLNEEFKQRALRKNSTEQEEKAKDLLAKLLHQPQATASDGGVTVAGGNEGKGGGGGGGGRGKRDPVTPRHDTPTYIEIDNAPDVIPAQQGRTLRVRVKVDAVDKFESRGYGDISLNWNPELDEAFEYRNETALANGWKTFQVAVDADATIGLSGNLSVAVEWDGNRLTDERETEVIEPRKYSGGRQSAALAAPDIQQVYEDDDSARETLGWDEADAVVEYVPNGTSAGEMFVAMFNENIQPIRETNDTEGTVEQHDRQYAAYLAYYEMLRHLELQEDVNAEPDEEYVSQEQNRVAKMLMRSISEGLSPEEMGLV